MNGVKDQQSAGVEMRIYISIDSVVYKHRTLNPTQPNNAELEGS